MSVNKIRFTELRRVIAASHIGQHMLYVEIVDEVHALYIHQHCIQNMFLVFFFFFFLADLVSKRFVRFYAAFLQPLPSSFYVHLFQPHIHLHNNIQFIV